MVFESETAVITIFQYAKNLKKDQRLVRYIPKEFYDRYRAMEGDAYLLRHGVIKYRTKVQMGISDLVLYKKEPGGRWSSVPDSEEWPLVNLSFGSQSEVSNAAEAVEEVQ